MTRRSRLIRLLIPGVAVFQFSGCLSDQQLTQIITSVISTGLNTIVSEILAGAIAAGGA